MSTEKILEEAYFPFQEKLSFEDFLKKFDSLPTDKWDFVRASLLYKQALKCQGCNPNIAMVLLCSSADVLKIAGKDAGSRRNFKEFYLRYCPSDLRDSPIEYYPDAKPPKMEAPFDKALDFIYSKFRCLYVHEGKGRLRHLPPGIKWIGAPLLDWYENEYYCIDTLQILKWFAQITVESLYNFLQQKQI